MKGVLALLEKLRLGKPWRYKIPLIMGFTYLCLFSAEMPALQCVYLVIAGILTSLGFAGFGYITNDLADVEKDRLAAKPNSVITYGKGAMITMAIVFVILALLPWLYLPYDTVSLFFIAAEFLLFVLYAVPPVRLKERGFAGIATDALYAYVVPAVLASWTFYLAAGKSELFIEGYLALLAAWMLITGIRNILAHQLSDATNDQRAGAKTFVLNVGPDVAKRVIRTILIPLEFVLLGAFLYWIGPKLGWLLALLPLYLVFATIRYSKQAKLPNDNRQHLFATLFLDEMYVGFLPIVFALGLALRIQGDVIWLVVLIHLLLFWNVPKYLLFRFSEMIAGRFPFRMISDRVKLRVAVVFTCLMATTVGLIYCALQFISD